MTSRGAGAVIPRLIMTRRALIALKAFLLILFGFRPELLLALAVGIGLVVLIWRLRRMEPALRVPFLLAISIIGMMAVVPFALATSQAVDQARLPYEVAPIQRYALVVEANTIYTPGPTWTFLGCQNFTGPKAGIDRWSVCLWKGPAPQPEHPYGGYWVTKGDGKTAASIPVTVEVYHEVVQESLRLFGGHPSWKFPNFSWIRDAQAATFFLVENAVGCAPGTTILNASCWKTTTCGATAGAIPGSADVARLDGGACNTVAALIDGTWSILGLNMTGFTQNFNTQSFALTLGTNGGIIRGGTFSAAGSTITVSGSFDISTGAFSFGTSTVQFNSNATLTTPGAGETSYLFNLIISDGVTVTSSDGGIGVANNATIGGPTGGTFTDTAGRFRVLGTFSVGSGVTVVNTTIYLKGNTGQTIPGITYYAIILIPQSAGQNYPFGGNIILTGHDPFFFNTAFEPFNSTIDTKGFNLTIQAGDMTFRDNSTTFNVTGSSTVSVIGNVALTGGALDIIALSPSANISFNGLDTNPGFLTWLGFTVTGLKETQTDAAAKTTLAGLTQWDTTKGMAWTYLSNSTSSILTWTISGVGAGQEYTVQKNGTTRWASGFADSTGSFSFTAGGFDPSIIVRLGPIPTPPGGPAAEQFTVVWGWVYQINAPDTPIFQDASTLINNPSNVNIASWVWDFGDGTTGSGARVGHAYPATTWASYIVTEKVCLNTQDINGNPVCQTSSRTISLLNWPPFAAVGILFLLIGAVGYGMSRSQRYYAWRIRARQSPAYRFLRGRR